MIEALGHYKILDRIGAGTLGDVYRARDTRLGRTVADQSCLEPSSRPIARRRDALSHDARVASVLSHPNIAALYEIGDEDGRLFLVFEFVPGEPLKRVIAGRPLNMRRAVDLATQMADALAEAHAARDRPRRPHARHRHDHAERQREDSRLRLRAMEEEPDAAHGESDHRTDIEALGALLFEMLTGKTAVRGVAAARRLDAARARRRLSARRSARMRRAATKRPRRLRPNCDRSPRFWTSGRRRPIRCARAPVRRESKSRAWIASRSSSWSWCLRPGALSRR